MPSFTVYKGSDSGIHEATTSKPDLTGDQVLVRVTASGLCGTDLHYKSADMALGHEGVGIVEQVGPGVKELKKGDRVGWGYEHDSCGTCQLCLSGRETFCDRRAMYGEADLDQGSFATHAVWREAFLFQVPEEISDQDAAPLMCGGATVFNALHMYDVDPTARVGVIGVGGLGHLAVQFASKMGCDVAVFSGSSSKQDEATHLGAHDFYPMKGKRPGEVDIGRRLNVLLVTTSAVPDWNLYIPLLAPGALVFPLSVADGDFSFPYMALLLSGIHVQGSIVAPRYIHRRMLRFAARHGIRPMVETFPLSEDGIAQAVGKLENGSMRYRGVLLPQ